MSNTLTHETGMLIFGDAADAGLAAPATDAWVTPPAAKIAAPAAESAEADAPVGYRWIAKRWRVLPDGTRDYAALFLRLSPGGG